MVTTNATDGHPLYVVGAKLILNQKPEDFKLHLSDDSYIPLTEKNISRYPWKMTVDQARELDRLIATYRVPCHPPRFEWVRP